MFREENPLKEKSWTKKKKSIIGKKYSDEKKIVRKLKAPPVYLIRHTQRLGEL